MSFRVTTVILWPDLVNTEFRQSLLLVFLDEHKAPFCFLVSIFSAAIVIVLMTVSLKENISCWICSRRALKS